MVPSTEGNISEKSLRPLVQSILLCGGQLFLSFFPGNGINFGGTGWWEPDKGRTGHINRSSPPPGLGVTREIQ